MENITYKITIEKTQTEKVNKREYEKIGEDNGENKYGYVSSTVEEPVTKVIYTQTFENIDISAIIRTALNIDQK